MAESGAIHNLLTQWARLFVGSLINAGVRRVVLSPGSRSTPLVAAVLRRPELERWVVIDERAAGFFALAQAKLTGQPTLLLCTSGSAAGHYLPAVIEADECAVPLLVVSADRPPRLQGCRAPQTIDQQRLFGHKVRHFVDLGMPAPEADELRALTHKTARAVLATRFPTPGPVHVNFPASKPLEPRVAQSHVERELEHDVERLLAAAPRVIAATEAHAAGELAEALDTIVQLATTAERPICAVGPTLPYRHAELDMVAELLAELRWPVWCEASCGLRFHPRNAELRLWDAFDLCLRRPDAGLLPDFVLQIGEPLTSGVANAWLARVDVPRVVVSPYSWADPQLRAQLVLLASEGVVAQGLMGRLPKARCDYADAVDAVNERAWAAVAARVDGAREFDEAAACSAVSAHLRAGDLLMLGNSLPIRMADAVLRGRPEHVVTLSQRGANGIDGLIAGAAGAASVHPGQVILVLGDVSALHDLGSLALLARYPRPLTVLVLNNGGGRIFEHLPSPAPDDADLTAWTTPHAFELYKAAEVFGVRGFLAENVVDLRQALQLSRQHDGACWIEARLVTDGAKAFFDGVLERPSC